MRKTESTMEYSSRSCRELKKVKRTGSLSWDLVDIEQPLTAMLAEHMSWNRKNRGDNFFQDARKKKRKIWWKSLVWSLSRSAVQSFPPSSMTVLILHILQYLPYFYPIDILLVITLNCRWNSLFINDALCVAVGAGDKIVT